MYVSPARARSRWSWGLIAALLAWSCGGGDDAARRGTDLPNQEPPPPLATPDGFRAEQPREVYDRGFEGVVVASGFDQGVAFAFAPGERLYVAEKRGTVRVVQGGVLRAAPFLDLSAEVSSNTDRGLLGIAVHPRFPSEPYIYLLYVYDPPELAADRDGGGARVSRLVRVEADANSNYELARPDSMRVLLGTNSSYENIGRSDVRNDYERPSCGVRGAYVRDCLPDDENSHAIGSVKFGPDGALYVSNGDGCDYTRAQPACTRALDLGSLAGKILRIDAETGQGLADNPFAEADLDSNRSKVYQLGLRNPFRFSFDSATGALYTGDVGENAWEEINRAAAGANFGWPCFEGGNGLSIPHPSYQGFARCAELIESSESITPAIFAYAHEGQGPGQGSAILVGDVYRGTSYPPLYRGALFYSDFNRRQLRFLSFDREGNVASSQVFSEGIGYHTQISADPVSGDLFIMQLGAGPEAPESKIERLVFKGYGPVPAPDALYKLTSADTRGCLESFPGDASFAPEPVRVGLETCRSDAAQRWLLENAGDELYRLRTESSDERLTMPDGDEPSRVTLSPAREAADQRFRFLRMDDGYQIINEASELCLEHQLVDGRQELLGGRCASKLSQIFEVASEANQKPTLAAIETQRSIVGNLVELRLAASDPEANALTFFASGLPPGLSIDPHMGLVMGELSRPGTYTVRVRVTDGELDALQTFYWQVSDDKRPKVTIIAPDEKARYAPGQRIFFVGSALDFQGRAIDDSALRWSLFSHHNQHVHSDVLPETIGAHGSFVAEDHGDNTSLELCLTATDVLGYVGRECRVLLPESVEYTIDSEPTGLHVSWEGVLRLTPFTVETSIGGKRDLVAPSAQEGLVFSAWSDGQPATHVITVGDSAQRLVARYAPLVLN